MSMIHTNHKDIDFCMTGLEQIVSQPENPIRISQCRENSSEKAKSAAEKLVIACRENVRFLIRHLEKYSDYLELPPFADNALYLAFTVSVKDDAPFESFQLRRHLSKAGIETENCFSFFQHPEKEYQGRARTKVRSDYSAGNQSFCLPCHQYLSIQNLQKIVCQFDTFISQSRIKT